MRHLKWANAVIDNYEYDDKGSFTYYVINLLPHPPSAIICNQGPTLLTAILRNQEPTYFLISPCHVISRNQNTFLPLPLTPQGSILSTFMWGNSEPASKNTSIDLEGGLKSTISITWLNLTRSLDGSDG